MWRLKQFMPKDQGGLEGKTVEVGALKLQLRSTIAQGGFSCVYLARDPATGRQYAVKHIICNDPESVDLVKKEVDVMKALRGHPNIVTLHTQVIYDMGRTKECFLVMDYCEKMLANVLESRGAGYFDEKQLLLIFRDVCNAVYAMHCQSPPIAHRDLKAENVLLGGDGLWKLCDFGSTSTDHKRFDKPDEMGLEEDVIRKHTTPAYRAPEMWDLFRRDLLNEKVDIWALGCLLYKIAYLKSAFDGESKLQILNGNYRIPEAPKYSSSITDLIRDMLSASPDTRPDVMQVWHQVNDALPSDIRKQHPDRPPSVGPAGPVQSETRTQHSSLQSPQGHSKGPIVPSRSPPLPPPHKDTDRRSAQNGTGGSGVGAFWSTPYAQDAKKDSSTGLEKNGASDSSKVRSSSPGSRSRRENPSPPEKNTSSSGGFLRKKGTVTNLIKKVQVSAGRGRDDFDHNGYEMRHDSDDQKYVEEDDVKVPSNVSASPVPKATSKPSNDPGFNEFAAQFDSSLVEKSGSNQRLLMELENVNKELQQALADKAALLSKYEKLTAICRSQQNEIQGLKSALNSTKSPSMSSSARERSSTTGASLQSPSSRLSPTAASLQSPSSRLSPTAASLQSPSKQLSPRTWQAFDQPRDKQSGTIWDLQEGLSPGGSTSQRITIQETNTWQPFIAESVRQMGPLPDGRRRGLQHTRSSSMGGDGWAFPPDNFSPSSSASGAATQSLTGMGNLGAFTSPSSPAPFTSTNIPSPLQASRSVRTTGRTQPAGWAGF